MPVMHVTQLEMIEMKSLLSIILVIGFLNQLLLRIYNGRRGKYLLLVHPMFM